MSVEDLLQATDNLDASDLERLFDRVLLIRARQKTTVLSPEETHLLKEINREIPATLEETYQTLARKRDEDCLTELEHTQLIGICNQMELLSVDRLKALTALADLRQVSLSQVMEELGIQGASFD